MRIGTWNLAGRWDVRHLDLVDSLDCDVLLLTEVSERTDLPGRDLHLGQAAMVPRRRWSAVASRLPMVPCPDPHGASAMADVDGLLACASILPWGGCGNREPWVGDTTADRTAAAVGDVSAATPSIWGGDWNHALSGREWAGSVAGRRSVLDAIDLLGLQVPTATLPHQIDGLLSIDHLAVPITWTVISAQRHSALTADGRLSDHDAYVVEVARPVE